MNIRAQKRAQAAPFGTLIRGDNQTARVRISVPRIDNGIDLSDLTWMAHVTNAEGQTDVVHAQDVMVQNSDIVMSVIMGGVATAAAGNTKIMIEGVNAGGSVWRSAEYYLRVDDAAEGELSEDDAQRLTALQELMLYVDGNLNAVIEAGDMAKQAYQHPPVIGENGNWFIWDWKTGVYVDSGKPSQGSGGSGGGGITQETDPTVPAWAKQPEKPKYTAEEVGAASKEEVERLSEEIVDLNEAVEGKQPKGDYALKSDIPTMSEGVFSSTPILQVTLEEAVSNFEHAFADEYDAIIIIAKLGKPVADGVYYYLGVGDTYLKLSCACKVSIAGNNKIVRAMFYKQNGIWIAQGLSGEQSSSSDAMGQASAQNLVFTTNLRSLKYMRVFGGGVSLAEGVEIVVYGMEAAK